MAAQKDKRQKKTKAKIKRKITNLLPHVRGQLVSIQRLFELAGLWRRGHDYQDYCWCNKQVLRQLFELLCQNLHPQTSSFAEAFLTEELRHLQIEQSQDQKRSDGVDAKVRKTRDLCVQKFMYVLRQVYLQDFFFYYSEVCTHIYF